MTAETPKTVGAVMPLLDHFHPPLSEERHWEGFHSKWANVLVDALNETLLPSGYFAEPHVHRGARVEIDAATFEGESASIFPARNGATAVLPARHGRAGTEHSDAVGLSRYI